MNRWRKIISFVLLGVCVTGAVRGQELFRTVLDPIPAEIDLMYVKGLKYLAHSQSEQGTWADSYGSEPGVVGIAVLAMLAHGEDPNHGPYSEAIKKGLNFILSRANSANGYIGSSMYSHGFSTLALAEAYGAVDDARLGPALKKAVGLILTSQSQNSYGAWRYSPESSDADTTVSGAQMVALCAARNAGIAVPEEAIKKGLKFFIQSQSEDGGIGYTGPGGPNQTRTAIGTLVFVLAKQKETRVFKAAERYLRQDLGQDGQYPFYYEYYAAQAYFHADTKTWQAWNEKNVKRLVASQGADGSWESNFGRTFSTGAALLSVALNYRFLPIYER